jgi:hypothetical protein
VVEMSANWKRFSSVRMSSVITARLGAALPLP